VLYALWFLAYRDPKAKVAKFARRWSKKVLGLISSSHTITASTETATSESLVPPARSPRADCESATQLGGILFSWSEFECSNAGEHGLCVIEKRYSIDPQKEGRIKIANVIRSMS